MTQSTSPTKAKLIQITNARGAPINGPSVNAHFNPETMSMTIRNAMEEAKHDMIQGRPSQLIASSEVSLSVQLLFDTTMDGTDVRISTAQIAEMMHPGSVVPREEGNKRPSRVAFVWNAFRFEGVITDYAETLDYFSQEGIPLRSSVDLALTKYDPGVPATGSSAAANGVGAGTPPPTAPVAQGDSVDDAAAKSTGGGASSGPAREQTTNALAAANEIDNKKNPQVSELASPDAAFSARAAAGAYGSPMSGSAFATAGAGFGSDAGAGLEFGAPPVAFASGDAGFGLDLGASAGAGINLSGGGDFAAGASLGLGPDGPVASASAGPNGTSGSTLGLEDFGGLNMPNASFSAGSSLGDDLSFDLPVLSAGASTGGAGISLGGAAGLSAGADGGIIAGAGIGGGQISTVGHDINLADILFKEDR